MIQVKLNQVCKILNGFAFKSEDYQTEGVPLLRISNFDDGDVVVNDKSIYVDSSFLNTKPEFIVEKGDILIALSGATTGKYGIYNYDFPSLLNQRIGLIKSSASSKLSGKYFYHYLNILKAEILRKAGGAAQPNISTKTIGELEIPLPPLPQQQKIANILDAADELRQNDKKLIAKYDELTQALFLDMFGDPVNNPKGWEKVKTIKYCDSIVPGRDKPKSFTGSTPWVTTNDLIHLGKTSSSKSNIGLSDSEILQVKAKIIPEGSVIMTCVGDLGIVTVNKYKMVVNQQLHAFICGLKLNNVFLMYNLSYQKPYMYKMSSSTTVPYMNKTVCNNIPTIVPPIELQNQFAERVAIIEEQKAIAQKSLDKSEDLFNSLLQKAFNGELV